ncbi:MAG: hypothetical protein CNF02_00945 [OM182 bacterium MED-G28]|uniref:DUF4892 domain-containing protein n=1 Tax=OM182 bacterium MED-G28 TaxID=1986256 RepID=A0A2A5WGC7_9GAMM|nr:MAG: hypothetical protein CNF02_00945 [OM182 bacterium MED-G28]|tara:strand:- start:1555 stop:2505 length:951 start_codon:yes stop_codon:yes gene_type:complete
MIKLFMKKSIIVLTCLSMLTVTSLLSAQSSLISRDHPLLSRFPDSVIASVEFDEDINYRLVLSSLQRTRGLVSSEISERLRGDVTKIVYEVSEEFNGQDVYDFFREQLQERNYEELFNCSGRECGSSNYWANDIFRNRILYGPERNQYYLAMRTDPTVEFSPHIALYIITRGNRRLYAYMEIIEVGGAETRIDIANPNNLLERLRERGFVIVPDIEFQEDLALTSESNLSAIVSMLQADPSTQIYLVSHLSDESDIDTLLERSQQRANVLRQLLIGRGINGNRIIARGVGPLAPSCNGGNCEDRVEIVLQQSSAID